MSYRFGEFTLDVPEHCLKRGDEEVYLRPRSFGTLLHLIERHGHLVDKHELMDALWSDAIVTENALTQSIKELRQALEDDAHHPRYIQTIPRVGYKFIAEVEKVTTVRTEEEEIEDEYMTFRVRMTETGDQAADGPQLSQQQDLPLESVESTPERLSNRRSRPQFAELAEAGVQPRRRTALYVGMASVLILLALGALYFFSHDTRSIHSVAVLPFANLSADPGQEYFADGMTEALIADLAKIGGLRVISRTSVIRYKEAKKPLPEIARELKVDAVVEGSVLHSGGRVRIMAQLIHAPTDELLWTDSYERDVRDIITLQKGVARAIAQEIKVELTPQEEASLASARPIRPAAYEAYLKGRYCYNKRTEEGFRKGIDYFQQAIEQEPNYALAFVGLADSYNLLNGYDVIPPREAVPKAKEAARRALEIDDTLAEAHASLAFAKVHYDWDWAGAESAFKQAIELNPSYAQAHHWYGLYLAMMQRFDEAMAEMKQAQALDPLSLIINTNVGWLQYFARRYDQAIETCRETLQLDPNFMSARVKLGWAYEQKRMSEQAIAEFQKVLDLEEHDLTSQALLGHAYAVSGQRGEAMKIINELGAQSRSEYVSVYVIATIYAGLEQKDQAFEWLEKAYEDRSGWLAWMKVDPRLDSLRADPRFDDLLRRVGLQ